MKKAIFLTATLSTALISYFLIQNQWGLARTPSSFSSPLTILGQTTLPLATGQTSTTTGTNPLQTYTYQDIINTYNIAISNEATMKQQADQLQAMLIQAQQNNAIARSNDYRRSPYGQSQTVVRNIESQLRMLQTLRRNNLTQAYRQIYGTYAHIQMPPTDGSPGLTRAHHRDAIARLNHLGALTQYLSLASTGYYNYPSSLEPYLVAAEAQLPTETTPETAVETPPVASVEVPPTSDVVSTQPAPPASQEEVVVPVFEETPVAL